MSGATFQALLGVAAIKVSTLVDRTTGTAFGNSFGSPYGTNAAAFDGTTNAAAISTATCASSSPLYVGKTWSSGKIFDKAIVYGSNDRGFVFGSNPSFTIYIYGKNGTPSSATDGTVIGSLTFTDTDNENAGRTITSSDKLSSWTSIWVYINYSPTNYCTELVLYELK